MRSIPLVVALVAALLAHAGAAEPARLKVLATFAPIYCFTANVAGDAADVSMLLSESAGPHDFALSPSDLKKIRGANVIIMNGQGLEEWLQKALAPAADPNRRLIDTSVGIEFLPVVEPLELAGGGHDHEPHGHDHEAGEANPHFWADPIRAVRQVENIREGLKKASPGQAATFDRNAAAFIRRLRELHEENAKRLAPFAKARLITSHDASTYFARRYKLDVVGVLEAMPGRGPTPKYLAALHEVARRKQVSALLAEIQSSPRMMESLGRELKIPVVPMDTMETGPASKTFYEETTRRNVDALVRGLSGRD